MASFVAAYPPPRSVGHWEYRCVGKERPLKSGSGLLAHPRLKQHAAFIATASSSPRRQPESGVKSPDLRPLRSHRYSGVLRGPRCDGTRRKVERLSVALAYSGARTLLADSAFDHVSVPLARRAWVGGRACKTIAQCSSRPPLHIDNLARVHLAAVWRLLVDAGWTDALRVARGAA